MSLSSTVWIRCVFPVAALLCAVTLGTTARGDGGQVVARGESGAYRLTLLTSPTPLRVGPVELSGLVQELSTGRPVLDAKVEFELNPPGETGTPVRAEATRASGANQLLHHAFVELSRSGRWSIRMRVTASNGEEPAELQSFAVVGEPRELENWPFYSMPFVLVALFVIHQTLKRRQTRHRN